jgi:hypothetical protein
MKRICLVVLTLSCAFAQDTPDSVPPPDPTTATASVLPALAPTPIPRPTWGDRGHVYVQKIFGPQAILETIPGAAFDFARGFPGQWPRTTKGALQRVASQYGQFMVGESIEMVVSAMHREDPRYFRMAGEPFGKRLKHSLVSTVIVRGANGGNTVGLARLADVYGSWAVATRWNPPAQQTISSILIYGTLGLGIKAASNVFREFWPDVKKHYAHH